MIVYKELMLCVEFFAFCRNPQDYRKPSVFVTVCVRIEYRIFPSSQVSTISNAQAPFGTNDQKQGSKLAFLAKEGRKSAAAKG